MTQIMIEFTVFTDVALSETEQVSIKAHFQAPEVKKYFNVLANNLGRDYLSTSKLDTIPAEELVRKHIYVAAQLDLLRLLFDLSNSQ